MNRKPEYYPAVGDKLYLSQQTGSYYIDAVKRPYTVEEVLDNKVIIRAAKCIFNGPIYYDSMPDEIVAGDETCKTLELTWANNKKYYGWVNKAYPKDTYPYVAHFGSWEYFPYLD